MKCCDKQVISFSLVDLGLYTNVMENFAAY